MLLYVRAITQCRKLPRFNVFQTLVYWCSVNERQNVKNFTLSCKILSIDHIWYKLVTSCQVKKTHCNLKPLQMATTTNLIEHFILKEELSIDNK